jgi:outer membrane protein
MRKISVLFFLLIFSGSLFSQKFGYMNSTALLSELPEVKAANANLEALQGQLQKKGQQMYQDLMAKAKALEAKEKSGEVAPKVLQDEAAKLETEKQGLMKYEQEMSQQVQEKRDSIFEPILTKVNDAIKAICKEQGYTFIFDQSTGVVLYGDEASDVTKLVKAKLGMP